MLSSFHMSVDFLSQKRDKVFLWTEQSDKLTPVLDPSFLNMTPSVRKHEKSIHFHLNSCQTQHVYRYETK